MPSAEASTWASHLVAARALHAVVSELARHAIPILPVKGIVTARTLYTDEATRPIRDIDVRLRRGDFRPAVAVARARGWHKTHVALLGQVMWTVDGVDVDVKSELGPPGLCALSVDDVMARAEERVGALGFLHLEPECNDHALMLVLNAFKDGLRSTPWAVEDLRRIATHPRFDPRTVIARARAGQVTTALWIVARWLDATQSAPGWRTVFQGIGPNAPSRRAAGLYALWLRVGCPRRVGHFVVPAVTDGAVRSVVALGQATAGLVAGYGMKARDAVRTRGHSPTTR